MGSASRTRPPKVSAEGLQTAPATPEVRIRTLDILRGFALLGILVVNARVLGAVPDGERGEWSADLLSALLVGTLIESKFYLLFSFLFGYSTALLTRGPQASGRGGAARYPRRLAALLVLGAGHALLLFPGDILTLYAVLGLLLHPLRRLRPHTLCRIGCGLLVFFFLLMVAYGLATLGAGPQTEGTPSGELADLYRAGPVGTVTAHLAQLPLFMAGNAMFAPHVLAAMILGLAAGKSSLLEGKLPTGDLAVPGLPGARRIVVAGLVVGLPGSGFMAVGAYGPLPPEWSVLGRAAGVLSAPALTAALGSLVLIAISRRSGSRTGTMLSDAGRMALTHYLCQSLVLCLVFTGYGLGLYGRVGGAVALVGCLSLFTAQLLLSGPVLRRWGRGPAEALVRLVSQGRTRM
ncbi:DUF418 domain-containing protein (plasmid) [Streptomyces globisporus]|uniref:DUF418 domain-containing protein n=1 Tax=Streptomyces globisporus TaxID=1908 RepID=UPI002F908559|nr:DUF418 domain-containing protein [Streptomyces globisporus]